MIEEFGADLDKCISLVVAQAVVILKHKLTEHVSSLPRSTAGRDESIVAQVCDRIGFKRAPTGIGTFCRGSNNMKRTLGNPMSGTHARFGSLVV